MAAPNYRQPAPKTPNPATPGVGEPQGHPGHPYISAGTMAPSPNAPYPQLPEAKPGTVPVGPKIGKGAPNQPSK